MKNNSIKSINIKPLADRVLVEPLGNEEREKTTQLGIVIPDTIEREKSEKGKVIAVRPGRMTDQGNMIPS